MPPCPTFALVRLLPSRLPTLWIAVLLAAGVLATSGCAEPKPGGAGAGAAPAPTADAAAPSAAESAPASSVAPPDRTPAAAGVGQKGRSLDKYDSGVQGAIAGPARALFAAKERVVFEIQIPHAMQLYKALNDNRGPPTHEAFMREIIEANQIALPQLPPGRKYVYQPEAEELFVEPEAP